MKKKREKKGGITIRIPKRELETNDTYEKVKEELKNNPEYAYTRSGLVVEIYNHKREDLNASFKDWPEGAPSQYTRVRLSLKKLENEGLIESRKQGKKFLYWWKGSK